MIGHLADVRMGVLREIGLVVALLLRQEASRA